MKWITVGMLCLLAGCAGLETPGGVRADGERSEFTLRMPAAEAARCMARNAEERAPAILTAAGYVREGATAGTFEIHVRNGERLLLVADVLPTGNGSRAVVHRVGYVGTTTTLPADMARGC